MKLKSLSLEVRALGCALLASALSLGGVGLAVIPIKMMTASPASSAPAPPVVDLTQGHNFYEMSCSQCHADDAHGDEGPDLHHLALSDARIAATIKKGIKGEMPAFEKKYSDPQIASLVAYLRSLP